MHHWIREKKLLQISRVGETNDVAAIKLGQLKVITTYKSVTSLRLQTIQHAVVAGDTPSPKNLEVDGKLDFQYLLNLLNIYLSVDLSIFYLRICLSVCLFTYLTMPPSICPISKQLSLYSYIPIYLYLPILLCIYLSGNLSINLLIYLHVFMCHYS